MNWWQVLLFPFAVIYDLITRFRNHLYNIGSKKAFEFEANVISVGNLAVGGTGKTPMVDYLIDHFLKQDKAIATLSRGYGRKTKGFLICTDKESPRTVGDEPYTYFEKYGEQVMVTVCEDRALAIPYILAENPSLDLILLDDAYQHRTVVPSFNVLLTTQKRPFWNDFLMPSGRLREARLGAKRANAIVVTKSEEERQYQTLDQLNIPYFQTEVVYGEMKWFFGEYRTRKVVLVCGLADNKPFVEYANANFRVTEVYSFSDHYEYNEKDLKKVIGQMDNETGLLTTEKDHVKLKQFTELEKYDCAYIPIKTNFLKDEERFLQMVEESLKDYKLIQ